MGIQPDITSATTKEMQECGTDEFDQVENRIRILGLEAWETDKHTIGDHLAFSMENLVAGGQHVYYIILLIFTIGINILLGLFWSLCPENSENASLAQSIFLAFQIFSVGGYDDSITTPGPIIVYLLMICFGLTIFAIMIGMITENFQAFVAGMNEGKTKATIKGHTLILGWNETTVRVVVQIALLRASFLKQNRTWVRTIFWWKRTKPSTPVTAAPVVIMANTLTKAEMQEAIALAFEENGISAKETNIGRDIICRIGDPCVPSDLQRVNAHHATSILTQMTGEDKTESENDDQGIKNGATLRTVLALRATLLISPPLKGKFSRRIVAELAAPGSRWIQQCIDLGEDEMGRPAFRALELNQFINGLMFGCLAQPGLAYALIELLGFKGAAFRSREVSSFWDGGQHIIGKTVGEAALLWEDTIFCGVVGDGLAPSSTRLIKADDRVIFISEFPTPQLAKPRSDATIPSCKLLSQSKQVPQDVLICGWRPEWNSEDDFAKQLLSSSANMVPGSRMMLLFGEHVGFDDESFPEFMTNKVLELDASFTTHEQENSWVIGPGVTLAYKKGNAAQYHVLHKLLKKNHFTQAVVISTPQVCKLPPKARDTRMFTILMALRHLHMVLGRPPLHVVVECALDNTALLAIGPTIGDSGGRVKVPDFVNAHVICASALVNGLAYPLMFGALSELFSPRAGTPRLCLEQAGMFVPAGTYTFGSLTSAVTRRFPDDMLIGVRKARGDMMMNPRLSLEITIDGRDFVMLITRRSQSDQCDQDWAIHTHVSSGRWASIVASKEEEQKESPPAEKSNPEVSVKAELPGQPM